MHSHDLMTNSWSGYVIGALGDLRAGQAEIRARLDHTNMRVTDMREDLYSRLADRKSHSRLPRVIILAAATVLSVAGHMDPSATRKLLMRLIETLLLGH
jgi:hypothetical protein